MPLTLAGAALAGQAALGIGQTLYGALKKKPEIPQAEIPQEIYDNMSDAEYYSFIGMPEEQRTRYIDDLRSSTATGMSRISDRRGGLGAVSKLAAGEREGMRDVATMDSKMRMSNLDRLYQARNAKSQVEMAVGDTNRNIAMQKRNEILNIGGAGMQNMMGAMGTAGSLSSMFGSDTLWNKKTQTPPPVT